jgi:uncharacterized protein YukE
LADKVKVSPDAFYEAITELQTVRDMLKKYQAEMSKNYAAMRESWQGLSGEAFAAQSRTIIKEFKQNIFKLTKHINTLERVAQAAAEADLALAASLGAAEGGGAAE